MVYHNYYWHFYKTSFLRLFCNYYKSLDNTAKLCKEIVESIGNYNKLAETQGSPKYRFLMSDEKLAYITQELCLASDSLHHYYSVAEDYFNTW